MRAKFGSIFTTQQERAANHMRDVFLRSQYGLEVFDYLLTKLHLYDTIVDEPTRILHNFALELLATMGIVNDKNRMSILKTWLNLPMPPRIDEAQREE